MRRTSQKRPNSPNSARKKKLDGPNAVKKRGRPSYIVRSEILQESNKLFSYLKSCWSGISLDLLTAKSSPEVAKALGLMAGNYALAFTSGKLPVLVVEAVTDRDFPKLNVEAQMRFIADSLAAERTRRNERGGVSARRSRQVCREMRASIGTGGVRPSRSRRAE